MDTDPRLDFYLQRDAVGRAAGFAEFVSGLKAMEKSAGTAAAAPWARRAVSVDLDYTSLRAVRRFVCAEDAATRGDKRLRLAVLGGPTTLQLVELLKIFLAARGTQPDVYECDYGLFRQEILTPGSGLDVFNPDVVFLATGARDAAVPPVTATSRDIDRVANDELGGWMALWQRINDRWGASVIQNTFEVGPWDAFGHYSVRHAASRQTHIRRLNTLFAQHAPAYVALHDLQALAAEAGSQDWFDLRFYLEAKMPCGPTCLPSYAHSVASVLLAILGKSRKVLVLDLDNTIWGGVVGDVGVEGLQVGQGSGQGEAFLHFQGYCKELHDRGILLAVCSKNDESIARRPFEQRPDMVLKLEHLSCFVANWNNKADNLREIARRLNLGLDSLVFVDDNPAERAIVRRFSPEVAVPDLPEDPAGYVPALAKHRYFETVAWTREDAGRGRYYAEDAIRASKAASFQDLDAFLKSLGMVASVEPVHQFNIERVTQLINKSNQFNLTTRRRTIVEVEALVAHPEWHSLTVALKDQLGDNGLISVVLLHASDGTLEIDTWLMSCRVLQRTVEQLVLNEIAALAKALRCAKIRGVYIPTDRNGLVKDHYAKLGFDAADTAGESTVWILPTDGPYELRQTHIRVERGLNHGRDPRMPAAGAPAGLR